MCYNNAKTKEVIAWGCPLQWMSYRYAVPAEKYAPCGLAPRQRFSPGYGDLPLQNQRAFFDALQCHKEIGLYLNESLLMSPTKSVTAIVGLGRGGDCGPTGCAGCENVECEMRK